MSYYTKQDIENIGSGYTIDQEPRYNYCSSCGWKKKDLKLEDREWICEKCHIIHAAKNIKSFGLIIN